MIVEFDVETTGFQWYADELFLVQFFAPELQRPLVLKHPQDRETIQQWLDDPEVTGWRAWNTKFDLGFLRAAGYRLPPESTWHDGMVLAHICDERPSNALAARHDKLFAEDAREDERAIKNWLAVERKLRKKLSKEQGTEYVPPNYSDVPDELMLPYAGGDVIQTRQVCDVYERIAAEVPQLGEVYELERRVLPALFAAEVRGVPIDRGAAVRFEAELVERLDRLHAEAIELADFDNFNPGSDMQLAEALQRQGADLTFVSKTPTGRLSMDEENLSAVDHPLAQKILALRDVQKMYGTYVKPMLHAVERGGVMRQPFLDANDRIHPSFNQVGARTGRMSSSDPNFQNWHRTNLDLRYLVAAPEGERIVTADLNAIEARVLAAYAPGGALKEIILSGDDLHTYTAQGIGLTDRTRSDGSVETARDRAKVFLYSVMYGAGVRSLRKQFGVSQAECKGMLERFHYTYPEIGALQRRIEAALVDQGYIKTAWGRRMRPYGTRSWEIENEAYKFLNYLIQGTAADIIKESTARCHEEGVAVIGVVHDEIVALCPTSEAEATGEKIVQALTDHPIITAKIPLEADATICRHWSDAKTPGYVPDYMEA